MELHFVKLNDYATLCYMQADRQTNSDDSKHCRKWHWRLKRCQPLQRAWYNSSSSSSVDMCVSSNTRVLQQPTSILPRIDASLRQLLLLLLLQLMRASAEASLHRPPFPGKRSLCCGGRLAMLAGPPAPLIPMRIKKTHRPNLLRNWTVACLRVTTRLTLIDAK